MVSGIGLDRAISRPIDGAAMAKDAARRESRIEPSMKKREEGKDERWSRQQFSCLKYPQAVNGRGAGNSAFTVADETINKCPRDNQRGRGTLFHPLKKWVRPCEQYSRS